MNSHVFYSLIICAVIGGGGIVAVVYGATVIEFTSSPVAAITDYVFDADEPIPEDERFTVLDDVFDVTTVVINGNTYALVASRGDDGIQIIDITTPDNPSPVAVVTYSDTDDLTFTLPIGITTVEIDSSTYAIVTAQHNDGSVHIIDITTPDNPTLVAAISDYVEADDPTGSIPEDERFTVLDNVFDITTVVIDGNTYALAAATSDNGVQIINMTIPDSPTPVAAITDDNDGYTELAGAYGVTTVVIDGSTYAIVTGFNDNGIEIIDITIPDNPSPTAVFTVANPELGGPRGVTTVAIDGSTYALVASEYDDSVQIIDITTPDNPSPVATITDYDPEQDPEGSIPDNKRFTALDAARDITAIEINGRTFAMVTARADDGVQVIDITTPDDPVSVAAIFDGTDYPALGDPWGITAVEINDSTYALVASRDDDGVQIIGFEYSVTCNFPSELVANNRCIIPQHLVDLVCGVGEVKIDFVCEDEITLDDCSDTQIVQNNRCIDVPSCDFDEELQNNECVELSCGETEIAVSHSCVQQTIEHCEDYEFFDSAMEQCAPFSCITPGSIALDHVCEYVILPSDPTVTVEYTNKIDGTRSYLGIQTNATHFFVADTIENKVLAFRQSDGYNVHNFTVTNPTGLATNSTHLFVTDGNDQLVNIFAQSDGAASPIQIPVVGFATYPTAVNSTHIFVADTRTTVPTSPKIQVFSQSDGASVRDVSLSHSIDQIATNSTHLFVSDGGNHKIHVYDQNTLKDPHVLVSNNVGYLATSEDWLFSMSLLNTLNIYRQSDGAFMYRTSVGDDTLFDNVGGIATNSTHLFVTDRNPGQVSIFEYKTTCPDGRTLYDNTCIIPTVITTASETTTTTSYTISGTAEAGVLVTLLKGDIIQGTDTADASGNWSIAVTLDEGANSFTATAGPRGSLSDPTAPVIITRDSIPTPEPRSTGGGGNSGKAPDSRVCGGVLCSEAVNVPSSTESICGAGTHKIDGICIVNQQSEPAKPEFTCGAGTEKVNGTCVTDNSQTEQYIPEPTDEPQAEYHVSDLVSESQVEHVPEPISEPTPEPTDNDVKCGAGTESVNGVCVTIQTQEPETDDDIFTKFQNWLASLFG